jgi:hypothetical protein
MVIPRMSRSRLLLRWIIQRIPKNINEDSNWEEFEEFEETQIEPG